MAEYFAKVNYDMMEENKEHDKYILTHLWLMEHITVLKRVSFTVGLILDYYKLSLYNQDKVVDSLKRLADEGIWKSKIAAFGNEDIEVDWSKVKRNDILHFELVGDVRFSNWINKWFIVRYSDLHKICEYHERTGLTVETLLYLWCWCVKEHGINIMNCKQEQEIIRKWKEKQERLAKEGNVAAQDMIKGVKNEVEDWEKEWGVENEVDGIDKESKNDENKAFDGSNSLATRTGVNKFDKNWFQAKGIKIFEETGISKSALPTYFVGLQECGLIDIRLVRNGKKTVRWVKICG